MREIAIKIIQCIFKAFMDGFQGGLEFTLFSPASHLVDYFPNCWHLYQHLWKEPVTAIERHKLAFPLFILHYTTFFIFLLFCNNRIVKFTSYQCLYNNIKYFTRPNIIIHTTPSYYSTSNALIRYQKSK